jgi:excisionase family DNA binding protein
MNTKLLMEIKPSIPGDLVSVRQANEITGINERTIWKKIRARELQAWGPRRCYRISLSELLRPVR